MTHSGGDNGTAFSHTPVLLEECIEGLNIKSGGTYVDGTTGGGGHSLEIVRRLDDGRLICFDQDSEALEAAAQRLAQFNEKVSFVHSNFRDMSAILAQMDTKSVDGILLDLGVSSHQLDSPDRGFSYRDDAPLDMRMDKRGDRTAADIVNSYSSDEIYRVIRAYGEERYAGRVTSAIVKARESKPIRSTLELADVVSRSIPARGRRAGHPARKTFQAIRIELNRELEVLEESLQDMIDLLSGGGRLCVISFHSLEDRIVKSILNKNERPCVCPPNFPVCTCGRYASGRVVNRKVITPSLKEIESNRRAKSARLRIFEKNGKEDDSAKQRKKGI